MISIWFDCSFCCCCCDGGGGGGGEIFDVSSRFRFVPDDSVFPPFLFAPTAAVSGVAVVALAAAAAAVLDVAFV